MIAVFPDHTYLPFLLSIIFLEMACMLVYMYILLFVCFHVFIYQFYVQRVIWLIGHPAKYVTLLKYCINKYIAANGFFIRSAKTLIRHRIICHTET